MAKKKTDPINADDFDFDNLDKEFGDLDNQFSMEGDEPKAGSREPISKSITNMGKGFSETPKELLTVDGASELFKKAIPNSLSSEYYDAADAISTIRDKYGESLKEVKKVGRQTVKSLDRVIPQGGMFRNILEKIKANMEDDQSYDTSKQNSQTAEIATAMAAVFGEQNKAERVEDLIKESMAEKRHKSNLELLANISANTEQTRKYHFEVATSYYKKSLELQYRHLFIAGEQLELLKSGVNGFKTQFETIIHNTALPEVLKARNSELLKETLKATARSKISDLFYSEVNPLMNLKKNATMKIDSIMNGLRDGLDSSNDMIDAYADIDESSSAIGGKSFLFGKMGGDFLRDKLAKYYGNKYANTEQGKDAIYNIKNSAMDLNEFFTQKAGSASSDSLLDGLKRGGFGLLRDLTSSNRNHNVEFNKTDLDEANIFDGRAHDSITKIIPGLLSKIYGVTKSILLKDTSPDKHEVYYNHDKNTFETKDDIVTGFKKDVTRKLSRSVTPALESLINKIEIDAGVKLSTEERKEFRKGITKYYSNGGSIAPSLLVSPRFLDSFSSNLKDKLSTAGSAILAMGRDDPSYLDYVHSDLKAIKAGLPNISEKLQDLHKSGLTDIGVKLGIIQHDDRTNGFKYNIQGTRDILTEQAGAISNFDIEREIAYREEQKIKANEGKSELEKSIDQYLKETTNKFRKKKIVPRATGFINSESGSVSESEVVKVETKLFEFKIDETLSKLKDQDQYKYLESKLQEVSNSEQVNIIKKKVDDLAKTKKGKSLLRKSRKLKKSAETKAADAKAKLYGFKDDATRFIEDKEYRDGILTQANGKVSELYSSVTTLAKEQADNSKLLDTMEAMLKEQGARLGINFGNKPYNPKYPLTPNYNRTTNVVSWNGTKKKYTLDEIVDYAKSDDVDYKKLAGMALGHDADKLKSFFQSAKAKAGGYFSKAKDKISTAEEREKTLEELKSKVESLDIESVKNKATTFINSKTDNPNSFIANARERINGIDVNSLKEKAVATGERLRNLRTEFFTSPEYRSGAITDFKKWLVSIGEALPKTEITHIEMPEFIKNMSTHEEEVKETKKIEADVTRNGKNYIATKDKIDALKKAFFDSEEFKSGSVRNFTTWANSLGFEIIDPNKFLLKDKARSGLSSLRSLDKKIMGSIPGLAGSVLKFGVQSPWLAAKALFKGGRAGYNAYNSEAVQKTLGVTRGLDTKILKGIPGVIGGGLRLGYNAGKFGVKGIGSLLGMGGSAGSFLFGKPASFEESIIREAQKKEQKEKEKAERAKIFDKDNSGRRDGDWRDRLTSMLGKKKDKTAINAVKGVKESTSIFGMLKYFLPLLGGTLVKILGFGGTMLKLLGKIPGLGKLLGGAGSLGMMAANGIIGAGKAVAGRISGGAAVAGGAVAAKGAISGAEAIAKKTATTSKIMETLKGFKELIIKKLGPKAGAKMVASLAAKIASKAIPILGQAALIYDAGFIVKYMTVDGMSFKAAVSKYYLGFDITDDNQPVLDENGNPIKPDESDKDKPGIFSSAWDKTKEAASKAWDSTKNTASDIWNTTKDTASSAWDTTKSAAGSAWDATKNAASKATDAVKNTAANTWDSTKALASKAGDAASSAWTGAKDLANGAFNNSKMGKAKEAILNMLDDVSKATGVGPNILKTFAAVESGLNPNDKAGTSSASGLFQFLTSTWNTMLQKYGGKYGIPAGTSPFDPKANALMGAEYIKENANIISKVKPNPGVTDLYMAHFLGAGGATKFLKADPSTPAAQILPQAAGANKTIFYNKDGTSKTVGQVYADFDKKMLLRAKEYGFVEGAAPTTTPSEDNKETTPSSSTTTSTPPSSSPDSSSANNSSSTAPSTPSTPPVDSSATTTVSTPSSKPLSSGLSEFNSGTGGGAAVSTDTTKINIASDSNKQLSGISETLSRSLEVQVRMLDVLNNIAKNSGAAITGQPQVQQASESPAPANKVYQSSDMPTPAIDLKRKQYI